MVTCFGHEKRIIEIVLLNVRRVVLVPFSEKIHPSLFQTICPPYPIPTQKRQRKAAELFGRRQQGGIDGNVKALGAAYPWTSAAAAAAAAVAVAAAAAVAVAAAAVAAAVAAAAAGGGSGACFAWLASGSGR